MEAGEAAGSGLPFTLPGLGSQLPGLSYSMGPLASLAYSSGGGGSGGGLSRLPSQDEIQASMQREHSTERRMGRMALAHSLQCAPFLKLATSVCNDPLLLNCISSELDAPEPMRQQSNSNVRIVRSPLGFAQHSLRVQAIRFIDTMMLLYQRRGYSVAVYVLGVLQADVVGGSAGAAGRGAVCVGRRRRCAAASRAAAAAAGADAAGN